MNSRETILKRLDERARKAEQTPHWSGGKASAADLAEQFASALRAVHGEVFIEVSLEKAKGRLGKLLATHEISRAVANREAPLEQIRLQNSYPQIQWHLPPAVGPNSAEAAAWRKALAESEAGLTSADLLLAETGTLVLSSSPGKSRLVSLLPPLHIALVPTARLVPDIFAWSGGLTQSMPSNTILVSGPSKTGDIEQTLSVGVHGPKQLIVIMYPDRHE